VDEALCFGWIDGLRKSLGETSYMIRFTPRKRTSAWSAVNLKRVEELIAEGRMRPAGLAAWENRGHSRRSGYTYEGPDRVLGEAEETEFKRREQAWAFFISQAPSYRRVACYWVMSAKQAATKSRRLETLIEDSAQGRRLEVATKYARKGAGERQARPAGNP
jgi:uncharacterized protein YdeI (YjbR/CyaY-like superfamily)